MEFIRSNLSIVFRRKNNAFAWVGIGLILLFAISVSYKEYHDNNDSDQR